MAAQALGSPRWRLVLRTVLPNCLSVVVVQLSLYFAEVLLAEAALSFLGLGEPPPTPTWGNILHDSQKYIRNAPWIAFFPGLRHRPIGARAEPLRGRRPGRHGSPPADVTPGRPPPVRHSLRLRCGSSRANLQRCRAVWERPAASKPVTSLC